MTRKEKLKADLKDRFTLDTIDFYGDGENVQTFVYYADEVSEDKAYKLYEEYDKAYNDNTFDGSFEEFLEELGITYIIL